MVHAVLGSSANLVNMSHLSGFNFPGKAFLPPPRLHATTRACGHSPSPVKTLTLSVDCLPLVNFRKAGAFCFLLDHVLHMIGAQEVFAK